MNTLIISWQRLVGDTGQTCDRCGTTQEEVRRAHAQLRTSLSSLDIDVVLEEKTLTAADTIVESNRIWIAGKPLETWLNATFGTSDCPSCGSLVGEDVTCRTIIVDERVYESIPAELIVKAGFLAAANLMTGPAAVSPCCGSEGSSAKSSSGDSCCSTSCGCS